MPSRRALIATLVVAGPVGLARAEDPRATFGLGPPSTASPSSSAASCATGAIGGAAADPAFDCAIATDPLDAVTPYALTTWLPGRYLRRLPVGDATHDAVAGYALGAGSDGAGVVIGGASGLENRWTVEGAPADDPSTGAADTRIPLAFLDGILVTAGGFSARDRASTGGTIDARLRRGTPDHQLEVDVFTDLSRSPTVRPSASGSYTLRKATSAPGPAVTASLVATGPIPGFGSAPGSAPGSMSDAWYAVGIAPSLSTRHIDWRAARVVDDNNDGVPDGLPGDVVLATIENTHARPIDYSVPVMARLGLDRGPHQIALSLVGSVGRTSQFLGNATEQAAGIDRRTIAGDAIATWQASWSDLRVRVQGSWHHSSQTESAHEAAAADLPQLNTGFVPARLAEDPVLAAACDDSSPSDPARSTVNCPVPGFFASGGAGELTDQVGDRPALTVDLAYRVDRHALRVGGTVEDTRLVTTSRFTGGELQQSVIGELQRIRFYRGTCIDDPAQPCNYQDSSELTYRTVHAAAYAEDTFALRDGLAIDVGLRWELMWVGTALHFSRQLAPRAGVTWDPLGGGRSRLWASYGRTFAMLPAGLGATLIARDATVTDFDLGIGMTRRHDTGAPVPIGDDLRPIEQDEVTAGGEVALAGALRATLWGQGRYLRHGLETVAGVFENPGAGGAPKATRETELVAFQLELRHSPAIAARAGVMWGRSVGTWTGLYDPRVGATQLNGADWNADPTNLYGALPTQLGGRMFLETEHHLARGGIDWVLAARLTAASGRPRNALASGGDGVVELLPRGSAGTLPVVTQANVRLGAHWRRYDVTLDVFNLFDQRTVTAVDEIYTSDAVRPIAGGTPADLVLLHTESGSLATRRTAYQLPIAYQAPLAVSLGVHAVF